MGNKVINRNFNNYKYYVYQREDGATVVKAKSTYAGRPVYGVAVCDKADAFDLEKGKKLAAARCNMKVADLRSKRAQEKLAAAEHFELLAARFREEAEEYCADSFCAFQEAYHKLEKARATM